MDCTYQVPPCSTTVMSYVISRLAAETLVMGCFLVPAVVVSVLVGTLQDTTAVILRVVPPGGAVTLTSWL